MSEREREIMWEGERDNVGGREREKCGGRERDNVGGREGYRERQEKTFPINLDFSESSFPSH